MEEKTLTIGRHALPDIFFGISPESMVQVYLSAKSFAPNGKSLVLSSPIKRALITAQIRAHVWNAPLIVMDELHESYLHRDSVSRVPLLCEKCLSAADNADYSHLHIVTHLPVLDYLHFPSCEMANFFVLKHTCWDKLKENLIALKPCVSDSINIPVGNSLSYFDKSEQLSNLFKDSKSFSLDAFCKIMDEIF